MKNIDDFKELLVNTDKRCKFTNGYNLYSLQAMQKKVIETLNRLLMFSYSISSIIKQDSESEKNFLNIQINNCLELLKKTISRVEKFNPEFVAENYKYGQFVETAARLFGYNYYINFYEQIYNVYRYSNTDKASHKGLLKALFERTKESCTDLGICTPSIEEIREMINNPDGDLCSKYQVNIEIDRSNRISSGIDIKGIPYYLRIPAKSSNIKNCIINEVTWYYTYDKYSELRGIHK